MLLASVRYGGAPEGREEAYPFSIPVVRGLEELSFDSPVTIFVGENGSGKSTLVEALAAACNLATAGGESVAYDPTLEHARALGKRLRLSWKKRSHRGFFLRSEDFFNFARRMSELRAEMRRELDAVERDYAGKSDYVKGLARMPYAGSLAAMTERYGEDLDASSHGESFLRFFQARFVPGGLYLMDEPEAPLSPLRQLAFVSMVREMTESGSQFVIATHSPIIMAFPGARIVSFDEAPPRHVSYGELAHVTLMRDFLNNPDAFIRNL